MAFDEDGNYIPEESPDYGLAGGGGWNVGDLFNAAKGLIPGASSSAAAPTGTGGFGGGGQYGPSEVPSDVTDWWAADEKARKAARDAEIKRAYETPEERRLREQLDQRQALEIQQTNVQIAYQMAQIEKMRRDMADETSPERKRLLELQIQQAQASLRKADLDYNRAMTEMPEEARIRLADQLSRERDALKQQFDLQRDALSTGVALRGQDIQQMKAQDDFVMQMLQAQIAQGRLSLDAATKKFDQWLTQKRLPSQIMESVAQSTAPFLPYMTDLQKGQVRPGFEKGGSMDVMTRLGGNAPGTYQEDKFKVNPVKLDLYGMAKKAGADFGAAGKAPTIPDLKMPDLSQVRSSLGGQLPGIDQYANAARGMMGGQPYQPPTSSVAGPTTPSQVSQVVPDAPPDAGGQQSLVGDDEYERLRAAVAGGLE